MLLSRTDRIKQDGRRGEERPSAGERGGSGKSLREQAAEYRGSLDMGNGGGKGYSKGLKLDGLT